MTDTDESTIAVELVKRILNGDSSAETELVHRYQRGLLFIIRRKCNYDESLASDIVQDTWHIVIQKIRANEIREPAKLSAFIIQTAKNLVIAHYRKTETQYSQSLDDSNIELPSSESVNPESFLERYNLSLMVKNVILQLEQQRDRDLLYRLFVCGQEKPRICRDLALNAEHFDRVLYRAKQRLVKLWSEHHDTS